MPAWAPSNFDPLFVIIERLGSQCKNQLNYSFSDDSVKASRKKTQRNSCLPELSKEATISNDSIASFGNNYKLKRIFSRPETLFDTEPCKNEMEQYQVPPRDCQKVFKPPTQSFEYDELLKLIEDISCVFENCSLDTFQHEGVTVPYLDEVVVNQINGDILGPGDSIEWTPSIDMEQEMVIDEYCRRHRNYKEAWGAIPKFSDSKVYYDKIETHNYHPPRLAKPRKTWSQLQEAGNDKELFSEVRNTLATVHDKKPEKQDCYEPVAGVKEPSKGVAATSQFQIFGNLFSSRLHGGRRTWNKRSHLSNSRPSGDRPECHDSEIQVDYKNPEVDNGKEDDLEVKVPSTKTVSKATNVTPNEVSESFDMIRKPLLVNEEIKSLSLVVSSEKAAQNKYIQNWLSTVSKTWENMNANENGHSNEVNQPQVFSISASSTDLESVANSELSTLPPGNTDLAEPELIPLPPLDDSGDQQELIGFNCRPKSSKWNISSWFKIQKPRLNTPEDIEDELSKTLTLIEKKKTLLAEEPLEGGDEFRTLMQSEICDLEVEKQQLEKRLYLQQVDSVIDIAEREVLTYMSSSSHSVT